MPSPCCHSNTDIIKTDFEIFLSYWISLRKWTKCAIKRDKPLFWRCSKWQRHRIGSLLKKISAQELFLCQFIARIYYVFLYISTEFNLQHCCWTHAMFVCYSLQELVDLLVVASCFNPLVASVAFIILLWLTLDDFTRQWETSWPPEG